MWVWITGQLNDTWNLAEMDAKLCTSEASVFGSFTFILKMGWSELTAASQTQKLMLVRPWSSGEGKNPKLLHHWVNPEFLIFCATSRALAQWLLTQIRFTVKNDQAEQPGFYTWNECVGWDSPVCQKWPGVVSKVYSLEGVITNWRYSHQCENQRKCFTYVNARMVHAFFQMHHDFLYWLKGPKVIQNKQMKLSMLKIIARWENTKEK